jgi:hypothetical protein
VLCPAGSVATGGAIDLLSGAGTATSSSGPVLDDGTADGARLITVNDGAGPAPIGWRASARSFALDDSSGRVVALCVPHALARVTTQIASITVASATDDSKRVLCPVGQVAYGGGLDVNEISNMSVLATAPVFDDGTANGQRLISRAAGVDAMPIGWFAAVHNSDGANDHLLKVAAICPEPAKEALEIAALVALGVRRRGSRAR